MPQEQGMKWRQQWLRLDTNFLNQQKTTSKRIRRTQRDNDTEQSARPLYSSQKKAVVKEIVQAREIATITHPQSKYLAPKRMCKGI